VVQHKTLDLLGFTEKEIRDLTTTEGFEILWIREEDEEPVTLFLVFCRKM
jgi:hypothetical protein